MSNMGETDNESKTGDKRILSHSGTESIRESIKSLQNHLGSGFGTDPVYTLEKRREQSRLAKEWAEQNDLPVIPSKQFFEKWRQSGKIRGGENRVYFEQYPDGKTWAIKMNDLGYHKNNLSAFTERLLVSSEYFPDTTINVIGMVNTPEGIKPLLRQEFVVTQEDELATRAAITDDLQKRGFRLLDRDNGIWLSPDQSYLVSDVGSNNVLLDEQGDLRYIDAMIKETTSEELTSEYPFLKLDKQTDSVNPHYSIAETATAASEAFQKAWKETTGQPVK